TIAAIIKDVLQLNKIGVDDNFFELGGNSLLAQKLVSELKFQFQYRLPITKLYQYPTIAGMAAYIEKGALPTKQIVVNGKTKSTEKERNAIAVIGMAGRFPGADDIDAFWDNLVNERESITTFGPDELDPTIPEHIKRA